jgi:hypothetical protein
MWASNASSGATNASNSDYTAVHVLMLIVFYKALRDATLHGELRPVSIALRYVIPQCFVHARVTTRYCWLQQLKLLDVR